MNKIILKNVLNYINEFSRGEHPIDKEGIQAELENMGDAYDSWTQIPPLIDIHIEVENNKLSICFYPVYEDDDGYAVTDTLNLISTRSFNLADNKQDAIK